MSDAVNNFRAVNIYIAPEVEEYIEAIEEALESAVQALEDIQIDLKQLSLTLETFKKEN